MKKTVSEKQIECLFQFTREHYVEHYDLQVELVDHLANAIEERWEQTPELPFEECMNAEFKKFGVFGFMDVVEKRQKALRKKYRALIWQQVADFFQLPKILLTGSLTFLLYLVVQLGVFYRLFFVVMFFLLMFFIAVYVQKMRNSYKKRIEQTGRKWVLEEYIFSIVAIPIPSMFAIYIQILLQAHIHKWVIENPYLIFLICLGVVVSSILVYVAVFFIPKKSEKYLVETYPEYSLV